MKEYHNFHSKKLRRQKRLKEKFHRKRGGGLSYVPKKSDKTTVEYPEYHITKIKDLPEDHFLPLSEEELQERKRRQWDAVKDLDDNDPRKIVYFRRFTREFKSTARSGPQLTAQSGDNFKYYAPDVSKMETLEGVEPLRGVVQIPKGIKIGFVIGYHHLEKPWGMIFRDMFQEQIEYDVEQIEFILVENKSIPTGERSIASEAEIQAAVQERSITHLIDIHEQLATSNHYMDSRFEPEWRSEGSRNPSGQEYILDPFVPTWMIEQYYQGNVYPQLQHAVNDQIKKVLQLIRKIEIKE